MSSLLYYSISSDLTENEIIEIDKQVDKNREGVYLFLTQVPSNSKRKLKRLCLVVVFMFMICQPVVPCGAAVVMPLAPAINRLSLIEQDSILRNKNSYHQIAPIIESKMDKIVLTDKQIEDLNLIRYKLENGLITVDKAILELRGGGLYDWATLAFIIYMLSLHQGNSFQSVPMPHMDPIGWISGKYDSRNAWPSASRPTTCLEMEKPASMPQPEYSAMSRWEKRQLPHHYDKIINTEGRSRLRIGFWQSRYKVTDHGALHGLPYIVKDNGGTKTVKSDKNTLAMMQSVEDMPNRPKVIWFDQDDVTYQGGTDNEIPAVHIFDDDTNVIAVFNKQTGDFVTTCQLTKEEVIELKTTHNFGGRGGWFSGKVNNLPPKGITPINSFENDIMGITPIDDSQIDNSNN